MRLKNTILIVTDLACSKDFYRHILGLRVLFDFHGYVTLTSGIALQSYEMWKDMIHKNDDEIILQNHAYELSFETEDIDEFMEKLKTYNIPLVHPLKEHAWGQRIVRFYDPDGHIIIVGESIKKVVKRFLSQGLSYEETAKRMNLPIDYIKRIIHPRAS